MGKKDLIGGSLWDQYSRQVVERMNRPRYRGELTQADAEKAGGKLIVADWGAESCGDTVRLYWIVDEKTDRNHVLIELRVASADMGKVIGKQGRIAKAIRTVVKAAAACENKKVTVDIVE